MIDTSHMRSLLRGADMILQSAQEDGLPQVRHVALHDNVALQVDTVAEVRAWADWRGLTVDRRPLGSHPAREIVDCRGSMYDVPFEVYTSTAVHAEPAGAQQ